MPLQRSDAILDLSDPDIILGPRKRHPTKRLLENGDPLACKKARRNQASIADVSDKEKLSLCSMPLSSHPIDTMPPPTLSTCPTNDTESGNDEASDGVQAIVVNNSNEEEATDKDDDAELGMCHSPALGRHPIARGVTGSHYRQGGTCEYCNG
jgi:hypothetical protein